MLNRYQIFLIILWFLLAGSTVIRILSSETSTVVLIEVAVLAWLGGLVTNLLLDMFREYRRERSK